MKCKTCKIFFLLLLSCILHISTSAQNFTGTWQGEMDNDEFLQINIVQVGTTICGYSWDYEMSNKSSFCKANFSGYYNKTRNICYVEGTTFIQNSGTHVLMYLKFSIVYSGGEAMLEGACQIRSSYGGVGTPNYFTLKKISKKPTMVTSGMQACMPPILEPTVKAKKPILATQKKPNTIAKNNTPKATPKPNSSVVKKPTAIKPKVTPPVVTPKVVTPPVVKKPTAPIPPVVKNVEPVKPKVVTPTKPAVQIVKVPEVTNGRKNNEQKRIVISEKKINISIYDNGTIDGDIVSVFFDNKQVVDNKKLTTNAISIDLELDETVNLHTLVLYAENLGTIPPNTALVVVTTASGKRYELYASATLENNAALVFEYKGK